MTTNQLALVGAMIAVVLAITASLLIGLLIVCVGRDRLALIRSDPDTVTSRLRAITPYVAVLAGILILNKGLQAHLVAFSYEYGIEPTALFYAIEGDFVAGVQGFFPDAMTLYFSGMYVFGYVVLLTFPLVAYLFASSTRPIKTTVLAYSINYAIAVVCYATVRAHGPRTYHEESESAATVSHGLVELFPDIVYLTSLVNSQTNIFPSLHASLSVTVLLIAQLNHTELPRWTPIAALLSTSVVVATMALGIHWLIDVAAGILLAIVSVTGARAIVRCRDGDDLMATAVARLGIDVARNND